MDGPDVVRFTSRPTSRDLVLNAIALARASAFTVAVGTFMTASSVLAIVLTGDLVSAITLVVGLSFLSGLFMVPFVFWGIQQRRDLVLAAVDVEADAAGVVMTSNQTRTQQQWSLYRRVQETQRAFVLDAGVGAVLVTKLGVDPAQIKAFRDLLIQAGLIKPMTRLDRLRPLLWVAIGLLFTAILSFGSVLTATAFANAKVDLVATVDGRRVTVEGTTNLPDGAIVIVDVTHIDEWDRFMADPAASIDETEEWWRSVEVRVRNGTINATIDVDGWPAGRGEATVSFWVDEMQPSVVTDAFGLYGSGMRGPDVYDDGYGGMSLFVAREIEFR